MARLRGILATGSLKARPGSPARNAPATPRAAPTDSAHEDAAQGSQEQAEALPEQTDEEDTPTPVFDPTRRSALADMPPAPGGLEGILNTQELAGSMTLIAPTAPSADLNKNAREKRLDERLK